MTFPKLRWKRLWATTSLLWIVGVFFYYLHPIQERYNASLLMKEEIDRSKKEDRFYECLARNKTTWSALWEKYEKECNAEALEVCNGSSGCIEYLTDECIKGRSKECRDIYVAAAEDYNGGGPGNKKFIERFSFYLRTDFSTPLKRALLLALFIPAILRFAPFVGRLTGKWFTEP